MQEEALVAGKFESKDFVAGAPSPGGAFKENSQMSEGIAAGLQYRPSKTISYRCNMTAILLFLLPAVSALCQQISGNWYCDPTNEVIYNGLGGIPGSYQRVSNMDAGSCVCSKTPQAFEGSLSPLDEDLSLHFRGPLRLSQFAAYTLSAGTSAKVKRTCPTQEDYLSVFNRNNKRAQEVYTIIPPIFTTTSGASVHVETLATSTAPAQALTTIGTLITKNTFTASTLVSTTKAATTSSPIAEATANAASPVSASWTRNSYYDAASSTAQNLVFLNNMGGVNGSGTWSPCFGNSLSYCSDSGTGAAAQPQILSDTILPSNSEFAIFSAEPCSSATCGYVADGVPAYVGFTGADKMFMFEFSMPSDASNIGTFNGDMPAIWALNGQIPRSQQYGACSCWQTGCGELDLFEVLSGGSNYMTTTFHSVPGGEGSTSNYFQRPTTSTMKAAVIFVSATKQIQIIELDPSITFDQEFAHSVYQEWQQSNPSTVKLTG